MRDVFKRFSFGAALVAGAAILSISAGAQAEDHWDHWDHRWDRDHYHHEHVVERPVYVHERPVVVERPMMMAPPPVVYAAPPAPSGLNLNFNIPLQ